MKSSYSITFNAVTDDIIQSIKTRIESITLPNNINAYSIEKIINSNFVSINIVFAKNYPINNPSNIKCETNQEAKNCFSSECDNLLQNIEAFQVGGYPLQIKNDTKENILTPYPGLNDILPGNCDNDDCVIFNTVVGFTDKNNIDVNEKDIKCIPKINGSCLPDFNIIFDQNLPNGQGSCPFNSVYLGDSIPTTINGSSLNELCLGSSFNILNKEYDNCKNLFTGDNMEGKCPWIGYDLFKDGAKDGTYKFDPNTASPAEPFWCFTDSGAPTPTPECNGIMIPDIMGIRQDCNTITNPSQVNCDKYYQRLADNTFQNCVLQDDGLGSATCQNSEKQCNLP
jgi:hypothetical protein